MHLEIPISNYKTMFGGRIRQCFTGKAAVVSEDTGRTTRLYNTVVPRFVPQILLSEDTSRTIRSYNTVVPMLKFVPQGLLYPPDSGAAEKFDNISGMRVVTPPVLSRDTTAVLLHSVPWCFRKGVHRKNKISVR